MGVEEWADTDKVICRIQGNEGVAGLTSTVFNVLKTLALNCGQNAGQGAFKFFEALHV